MKQKFGNLVKTVILSMFCLSLFNVSGCVMENNNEKVSVSMILGVHSNTNILPLETEGVTSALFDSCYYNGDVNFVTCEGTPRVFYSTRIPKSKVKGLSENKKKMIAEDYVNQLKVILQDAVPITEEVDTLKSINQAVKCLQEKDGRKFLYILDSGIQTTGYLDLRKGYLNSNPDSIVEALKNENALPNLDGIDVIWYFLGQTAMPQESLSENQKVLLRKLWQAVLEAGGAHSVEFKDTPSTSTAYRDLPKVSTIQVEEENLDVVEEKNLIKKIVLGSRQLGFIGDKAEFVSRKIAENVLSDLADTMRRYQDNKILVIGTTAGGKNAEFLQKLSEDRANAVKDLLVSMDVSDKRILTLGLATQDPWHLNDLDQNGHQIEDIAAQNRKVVILDINDPEAEQFFE